MPNEKGIKLSAFGRNSIFLAMKQLMPEYYKMNNL